MITLRNDYDNDYNMYEKKQIHYNIRIILSIWKISL